MAAPPAASRAPTQRFSDRVDYYVRYRPHYPPALVEHLAQAGGLRADSIVADIGAGTGFLSEVFLQFGCTVYGVEPNADMRRAAQSLLATYPGFHPVDGSAEATGLPAASVDWAVAGQAFHWFDAEAAAREFRRILRPGGWLCATVFAGEDPSFGRGQELEPNTFDDRGGRPAHYFSAPEVNELLRGGGFIPRGVETIHEQEDHGAGPHVHVWHLVTAQRRP